MKTAGNALPNASSPLSVLTEKCKNGNGTAKNNQAGPDENAKTATDEHMV
jgi:hypothetical protein